jgi:hypothetical protein
MRSSNRLMSSANNLGGQRLAAPTTVRAPPAWMTMKLLSAPMFTVDNNFVAAALSASVTGNTGAQFGPPLAAAVGPAMGPTSPVASSNRRFCSTSCNPRTAGTRVAGKKASVRTRPNG